MAQHSDNETASASSAYRHIAEMEDSLTNLEGAVEVLAELVNEGRRTDEALTWLSGALSDHVQGLRGKWDRAFHASVKERDAARGDSAGP